MLPFVRAYLFVSPMRLVTNHFHSLVNSFLEDAKHRDICFQLSMWKSILVLSLLTDPPAQGFLFIALCDLRRMHRRRVLGVAPPPSPPAPLQRRCDASSTATTNRLRPELSRPVPGPPAIKPPPPAAPPPPTAAAPHLATTAGLPLSPSLSSKSDGHHNPGQSPSPNCGGHH